MISTKTYEEVIFQTIVRGATTISADVKAAFENAIARETSASAREGLQRTYDSLLLSKEVKKPACPDTGWPIFYFKVGNDCQLEGGLMALHRLQKFQENNIFSASAKLLGASVEPDSIASRILSSSRARRLESMKRSIQ